MASPQDPSLLGYEKQRLENVKRNQAMIAALGIQNAKAEIQLNAKKRVGVKRHKRSAVKREREEPVVTRRLRSSRVSWTSEDVQKPPTREREEPDEPTLTQENSRKPVPLASVCIQGSSADSLIRCLHGLDDHVSLLGSPTPKKESHCDIDPSQFSLQKGDIARVVPERILSVAFLPVSDKLLVVAGDKGGHLGFWDVECDDTEGDGVYAYQPHAAPVSGISIASFSATKVFTCSYDGTVKQLDVESSMFDLMYCLEEGDIFSAVCSVPGTPSCVYVGEGFGFLRMLDTREKGPTSCVQIHQRRINTIDLNTQLPWEMVTSSRDRKACVWDVRNLKNDRDMIGGVQHQHAVHSAAFSPSGSSIATCSYDNTVAILKLGSYKTKFIAHPNMNNHMWTSTFRAIWGWDDEYVYVGNMKKIIDIISIKSEIECHWLSSPQMTSVPSRLAAHPLRRGILAGCSAGGKIFIWRQ